MNVFRRAGSFFLDLVETVVIALAVFVLIYLFLFQPHQVRGSSMYPSLHDGEYLLTDKVSYRLHQPKRGDVIIFTAPHNEEYDYIKRIIGLPGETIKIENGKVFINGLALDEVYIPNDFTTFAGSFAKEGYNVLLPPEQYFVLGDNRQHSSDSREWGSVPEKNIIGRAAFRYWPVEELGSIKEPDYQAITSQ